MLEASRVLVQLQLQLDWFQWNVEKKDSTWLTVVTNHLNPNQTPAGDGFKSMFLFYSIFLFISNPMWTEHLKARNGPFIHSSSPGKSECKYELTFLLSQHDDVHSVFWLFCHADKFEVIHRCVGSTWAFLFCLLVYFFHDILFITKAPHLLTSPPPESNLIWLDWFQTSSTWKGSDTPDCVCVILQVPS